jgi:hypothetical protein
MQKLAGEKLSAKHLPSAVWNADLVAFDGPFLSLFQDDSGKDLLYMWLDCDNLGHRWAILRTSRETLGDYLRNRISLLTVLQRAGQLLVYDQVGKRRKNVTRVFAESLPASYLPTSDSYLTREVATKDALRLAAEQSIEYELALDGELFIDDLGAIPRLYQQLYSFHYGLEHLERPAIKQAIVSSLTEWTSGLKAVNLFSGLTAVIPSIHRPRVTLLKYASPGSIKLELLPAMALQILNSSKGLEDNKGLLQMEELYKAVYRYFKKEKLSGFEDVQKPKATHLTDSQHGVLAGFVEQYITCLGWQSYQNKFARLEIGPLQQLRAILAYHRRLKKLAILQHEGKLRLTEPTLPTAGVGE